MRDVELLCEDQGLDVVYVGGFVRWLCGGEYNFCFFMEVEAHI